MPRACITTIGIGGVFPARPGRWAWDNTILSRNHHYIAGSGHSITTIARKNVCPPTGEFIPVSADSRAANWPVHFPLSDDC
jgi:hypothetical protein